MSGTNTESHEEKATCRWGKEGLKQSLAGGVLEKLEGVALDASLVPVRPASGLGAETSSYQRLKRTRIRCFWDLQRV